MNSISQVWQLMQLQQAHLHQMVELELNAMVAYRQSDPLIRQQIARHRYVIDSLNEKFGQMSFEKA